METKTPLQARTTEEGQPDGTSCVPGGCGIPGAAESLEVPADVKELDRVNSFLHEELNERLCPLQTQNEIDIIIEELFVNVCNYAYQESAPGESGKVRITRTYGTDPSSITVEIIDDGMPYDPLAKPDVVTPEKIEDVPIGGLGILMAKKCADEMFYTYAGGKNIVTIVKRW